MGADCPRLHRLFSMSDDALPFQAMTFGAKENGAILDFAARGGPKRSAPASPPHSSYADRPARFEHVECPRSKLFWN